MKNRANTHPGAHMGVEGWYMGPDMDKYRFHTVFANKTQAERIADIVNFFLEHNKMPVISNQEASFNAAIYLVYAISNP